MKKPKIIVLVGESSSGKDKFLNHIVNLTCIKKIISHTSRPMRNNEIQDMDYHFVEKEVMLKMKEKDKFIETRDYIVANNETWYYGISKDEIDLNDDNIYITILDFQGLKTFENYFGKEKILSIFLDVDARTRVIRSLKREGNIDDMQVLEVARRLLDDNINVKPAKEYCDLVFKNNVEQDLSTNTFFIRDLLERMH